MARDILDVVDHVYASVEDPLRLVVALEGLARLLDARAAGVRVETAAQGVAQTWSGLEPSFDRAYVAHYWAHDPWAARVWSAPVGAFVHGDALCERKVVEASAMYNELALPSGFDDLAGGILERSESRVVSIGVMKGRGAKPFDAETNHVAKRVLPHLARALSLRARLTMTEPSSSAMRGRLAETLRTTYALTPAEVEVAIGIGAGLSPKDVATTLGCSWHTVRAHLRQVFAKTERRSQSALARLVVLHEADISRRAAL